MDSSFVTWRTSRCSGLLSLSMRTPPSPQSMISGRTHGDALLMLTFVIVMHVLRGRTQGYKALFAPLLSPPVWERKGNVPAVTRLLQVSNPRMLKPRSPVHPHPRGYLDEVGVECTPVDTVRDARETGCGRSTPCRMPEVDRVEVL